jgi:DNA processing protein
LAAAWTAPVWQLQKIGLDQRAIGELERSRAELDLQAKLAQVEAVAALTTWEDEAYPAYLREIPAPPPVLYIQGEILPADQWAVAIVGTRRMTAYGRQVTRRLVADLVRQRITIVSGLARGVDAVAHRTALELGGRTIAVLGSGLDCIYPAEHRRLAAEIADGHGAVVTDYGFGVRPEAKNFPPRNRIISGLSLGVVVIEAGERSGALITTKFALEQDREVFAVPGNITNPYSMGCHHLLQAGAKCVTGVDDILEELRLPRVGEETAVQLSLPESAEEAALFPYLSLQPVHIDELSRKSGLPNSLVNSTLMLMELKGTVQQVGGMRYALVRGFS